MAEETQKPAEPEVKELEKPEEEDAGPTPYSMFVFTADKKIKKVDLLAVDRVVTRAVIKTLAEFLTKLNLLDKSQGWIARDIAEHLAESFLEDASEARQYLYEELKRQTCENLSDLQRAIEDDTTDRAEKSRERIEKIKKKLEEDPDLTD